MFNEEVLIEKYDNLKENLAELVLLRENIISIRDDMVTDDEVKFKLLYKKYINNLVKNQNRLEKDVIKLIRAGEILKYLEFENNYINLNQIIDKITLENELTEDVENEAKRDVYCGEYFEDIYEDHSISDELFKDIAKKISPNVVSSKVYEYNDLWKETLRAKSDNESEKLSEIYNSLKKNDGIKPKSADYLSNNISNMERNLKILNNEIEEITKTCRENIDFNNFKNSDDTMKLLKEVENKQKELKSSIDMLMTIKKNLEDGFIGMLPNNNYGILN